jgi:hypothetical protein
LEHVERDASAKAARNIARAIGTPASLSAMIVCSASKRDFAAQVAAELSGDGIFAYTLGLAGDRDQAKWEPLKRMIGGIASTWALGFFISWQDSGFLFDVVGRPDTGIKIRCDHLYCDFCIRLPGLIRTASADPWELENFKGSLLKALADVPRFSQPEMEITTRAGTRVTLLPRKWNDSGGEVFTAPVEGLASGAIVVDGCAYSGPPKVPFALKLKGGQVANLDELEKTDDQQRMVLDDLTRDANARVLAELGIGAYPEAREDADLMEAEQARGTCHFGFGHNVEYGGTNASSYHFDLVVRRPTIKLGKRVIMKDGVLVNA